MEQTVNGQAILAIEAKRDHERAALLAPVQGAHRMVAEVTAATRGGASSEGVRDMVNQLQQLTGYKLLTAGGEIDGSAVGAAVVSGDPGQLLQVALLATTESDLVGLQDRVMGLDGIEIALAASLQGRPDDAESPLGTLAARIEGAEAQVILIDAMSRQAAGTLGALVAASHLGSQQGRVPVIFAGGTDIASVLGHELCSDYELLHISIPTWLAKDFRNEDLQAAMKPVRVAAGQTAAPAAEVLGGVPSVTERQASTGRTDLIRFLAAETRSSVCVVDAGGGSTTIITAREPGSAEDRDHPIQPPPPRVHVSVGQLASAGMAGVLKGADLSAVSQWLPFDAEDGRLRDYLGNRDLRPWVVLHDARDLIIDQAVARAGGQAAGQGEVRADFLIASGGIATYPRLGQVVLTLLDIAQPVAPCRLLIDRSCLLSRLGILLGAETEACLSVLRSDTFVNAGVCLSLLGRAKQGDTVAEVSVQRSFDSEEDKDAPDEVHEIRFGTITVIPLSANKQAAIRVATGRRFSFGIESSGQAWTAAGTPLAWAERERDPGEGIVGGLLGLVVDARGRPLELSQDQAKRQALMSDWLRSLDAYDAELFSVLDWR
jgi:MutL protein